MELSYLLAQSPRFSTHRVKPDKFTKFIHSPQKMFAVQTSSPLTRNTKPEQQPLTNHMTTTHKSHDNHVRANRQPLTNHMTTTPGQIVSHSRITCNHVRTNRQPLTNHTAPHLGNMKYKALTLNTFQTLRCIAPRTLYSI